MAFTPLSTRLKDLPIVLAGPMVRRVEPESVSVWIVLREARDVRLVVDDPNGVWQSDLTSTHEIGEFLHMALITARPPQPMADGAVLNYNIQFLPSIGGTATPDDLFTPKIVAKTSQQAQDLLTYPGDPKRTPSFMVPPAETDKLRILHTSCRHIEGNGIDAFPALDHLLDEHMRKINPKRPAMLFLTGDQIYADGSGRELLDILTDIGDTLLDVEERLPVVQRVPSELPRSRMVVAVDDAGLKNPREFPTLALGEFIALYLLTFSDVLWPPDAPQFDAFKAGLPVTRRLFANIATYMIFDDHEVSDSLYLTWSWITPMLKSDLGRRVLQNAFTAYALCQGWGNTPQQFAPPAAPATKEPPGLVLLKALKEWRKTGYATGSDHETHILQALGIPDLDTFEATDSDLSRSDFHGPDTIAWHYVVPCKAAAINVLDVYTWKEFVKGEFDPADHLPPDALDQQVHQIGNQSIAIYVMSNVGILRSPRTKSPDEISKSIKDSVKFGIAAGVTITTMGTIALYLVYAIWGAIVFWIILGILLGLAVGYILFVKDVGGSSNAIGWLKSTEGRVPSFAWLNRAIRSVHYDEVGTEFEWHSAPFERLLDRTARDSARQVGGGPKLAQVVFLSGDVHESYAMRLSYFADFTTANPDLRAVFAQLVSSPSKRRNESNAAYGDNSSGEFVGWKQIGGDEDVEPKTTSGAKVKWLGKGEFWVARIDPQLPPFSEKGEHRYRIEPIKPNPKLSKVSTFAPNPPATFEGFLVKLKQHQKQMLARVGHSPIVSVNNVSDVTFPSPTTVRQDVWWRFSGLASQPPAWFATTYDVELTPPLPPKMPVP